MSWGGDGRLLAVMVIPSLAGCSALFAPEERCAGGCRAQLAVANPLAEAVEDFPLLITLTPARAPGLDFALAGDDLRFTGADGANLPHEIDHWDGDAQTARVWVRVPELSADGTRVWLHYGDGDGGAAEAPAELWQSFSAVWHMNTDLTAGAGQIFDSSPNENHGATPTLGAAEVELDGAIGPALRFEGVQDPVVVPDADSLDASSALTLEAWVMNESEGDPTAYERIIRKYDDAYGLIARRPPPRTPISVSYVFLGNTDNYVADYGQTTLTAGTWFYIAGTYDQQAPAVAIFNDGVLVPPAAVPGSPDEIVQTDMRLSLGHELIGLLDEVRISRIARSPAWVGLQYLSMADKLLEYGAPEPP